jgi:WD40 repeat protein
MCRCVGVFENHVSVITSLAVSEDGLLLFSASRDKTVNVWKLASKELVKTIPVFEVASFDLSFFHKTHFISFIDTGSSWCC